MFRLFAFVWVVCLLCVTAFAYRTPPPKYVLVDLTWKDSKTGQSRTVQGQLWFMDLPIRAPNGRIVGLGQTDHFDGIKWVVPKKPGDIWMTRGTNTAPDVFVMHDYYGEREIALAFREVDVTRTDDAKLATLMDQKIGELEVKTGKAVSVTERDRTMKLVAGTDLSLDEGIGDGMNEMMTTTVTRAGDALPATGASPLRFASPTPLGIKSIPVADIQKIVFLTAADGYRRETYRGRFVEYSNQAVGDEGRVQIAASTHFGGPNGDEGFRAGRILNDGSIVMAGDFRDLDFVDPKLVHVVGSDPPADAYPPKEVTSRGRTSTVYPRRTIVLVHYAAGLQSIQRIVRLPWGTGTSWAVIQGPDDALYISGLAGPHFDLFAEGIGRKAVVEYPEEVEAAGKAKREPAGDGFVIKLSSDHRSVEWLARFKHAGVDIHLRPDGKVLARRGDVLFFVNVDGSTEPGPKLDIVGSKMGVCPISGAMYFGGSYRSGTGLEPYVCPYLYKVDADGNIAWTAYSWTGPIVGVEQQRLVSDSSITRVRVAEDGTVTFVGWSDGGNTVLSYQPYDMRQEAPSSGFCSSLWGADGTTVRIGHIVHMNQQTMEVDYCTKYVAYKPTCDIPAILNIYDMHPLPNGDVAVTGSAGMGFVETHDSWVRSWYLESRTNEFAVAKNGTFFTLFRRGFALPRMSTRTPGVSGGQLSGRGKWLLLYSTTSGLGPDILRNAVQPGFGGGMDAFVILIDTFGPRRPVGASAAAAKATEP
jgi:hypothetical protein